MNCKQRRGAQKFASASPPDPIAQMYAEAIRRHEAGVLGETRAAYERVVELRPNHAEALCNLDLALQARLLSLPRLFATTAQTIPAQAQYLAADAGAIHRWRLRLREAGLRVGIAWQGKPGTVTDRGRSFPLASLAPLSRIPGVRLISLQKNVGVEQLAELPEGMRVEMLGSDFDIGPDAFVDTAAVMTNLDLIVTSDTAIAHLAGALGRRTWVALKSVPDWRWQLGTPLSPWYPKMRLFRQSAAGDWNGVFAEMADALAQSVSIRSAPR